MSLVDRALVPIVLVVVGFQSLIQVKGQPSNALSSSNDDIISDDDVGNVNDDDGTDSGNTSRNSNRYE